MTADPAAATLYRVALSMESVERVLNWGRVEADGATPFPLNMAAGDTAVLGERTGADREAAVGALLAEGAASSTPTGEAQSQRLALTQQAAHAGVPLDVVVVAVNYIGKVPVALDARLKIG